MLQLLPLVKVSKHQVMLTMSLEMVCHFAVDTTGDGKKIQNVYDIPAYIDNLKKMHDYYTKGLIPADAATSNTAF